MARRSTATAAPAPIPEEAEQRFRFRKGSRFRVKADVAGQELERIKSTYGGRLKIDDVIEESSTPGAPLYDIFNWDDSSAAHAHRRWQARQLISSIEVYVTTPQHEEPQPIQAYVHIGKRLQGYELTSDVLDDEQMRAEALADALSFLTGVRRRYNHLQELARIWQTVEEVEEEVKPRRRRPR